MCHLPALSILKTQTIRLTLPISTGQMPYKNSHTITHMLNPKTVQLLNNKQ